MPQQGAGVSAPDDRERPPLDTLLSLLTTARAFAAQVVDDPLMERLLGAFSRLPQPDREAIVGVIERDATWCRIVEQTADTTGITVRPNPQASLYVHVLNPRTESPDAPLRRDVDVIRFGIERFVHMLPFLFQDGVHQQWVASAHELIAEAEPELRAYAVRLCQEVLGLIAEADAPARA
jgi:hypothetical protein